MISRTTAVSWVALASIVFASTAVAQVPLPPEAAQQQFAQAYQGASYSPYASADFPNQIFWGDTHLHTAASMDAGAFGNRLGLSEAYRFARGEEVVSSTGIRVRLSRPLDWLVIADHSDNMGFFPGPPRRQAAHHRRARKARSGTTGSRAVTAWQWRWRSSACSANGEFPERPHVHTRHQDVQDGLEERDRPAAEEYNDPGQFTAFIGFEWTSLIKGGNMHRVVVYRDGASKAEQMVAYTTTPPLGSPDPMDLWTWLTAFEDKTGGDVLAIAHNGNLSNGIMFPLEAQWNGRAFDQTYVTQRAKWEPLYETTQIKGDGETHSFLSRRTTSSPTYETWDVGNLDASEAKTDDMLAGEYAREALKRGMAIETRLGTNPYKFGQIGSTDSHTSLATAQEDNFFGKHSGAEPGPERMEHPFDGRTDVGTIYGWQQAASGLAAVWARENTREAIFDAMERKETYATTGSRAWVCASSAAGISPRSICGAGLPRMWATARACRWAVTCRSDREQQAPTFLVYGLEGRPCRWQSGSHSDRQGLVGRQGRSPRRRSTTWSGPGRARAGWR